MQGGSDHCSCVSATAYTLLHHGRHLGHLIQHSLLLANIKSYTLQLHDKNPPKALVLKRAVVITSQEHAAKPQCRQQESNCAH
jgi:hypothetical protein